MLSHALRRLFLLLLCLLIAPCVRASERRVGSIGTDVQDATLIVIADTALERETYDIVVTIKEVLKGDQKWSGQTLRFPRRPYFDTLSYQGQNRVLLFAPAAPDSKDPFRALETYTRPDVAIVRALISINALPTERAQLLALRETWANDNPLMRAEFIRQLSQMHEAENFDVLLNFYPRADEISQRTMVEILGRIGDARALPLLVSVLEDEKAHAGLRYVAAYQLNSYFPGAPGVTEAFRRIFLTTKGDLQVLAGRYLNEREPDAKYQPFLTSPTLWLRADELVKKGDKAGARELWWQVLAAPKERYYPVLWVAQLLLPDLKTEEKARFRAALLPHLQRTLASNDYTTAVETAQLLRAVDRDEDIDLWLALLDQSSSSYAPAQRIAVLALRELGADAQQKASAHLLQNEAQKAKGNEISLPNENLMALAWLGSDDDWQQARTLWGKRWQSNGQFLEELQRATHAADESAALIALLSAFDPQTLEAPTEDNPQLRGNYLAMSSFQRQIISWSIFRLGDLADVRAVPVMMKLIGEPRLGESKSIGAALTQIGQKDAKNEAIVVEAASQLLNQAGESKARAQAVQIIADLQGTRALPRLRRLAREDTDISVQIAAVSALGNIGTPDDVDLLLPLANFWSSPRDLQYWAVDAVTHLRNRFNLDVGGVARKAKA